MGDQINIVPVPGASAVTTLLSAAGIPADKFTFFGFLPHKNGRQTLFKQIRDSGLTIVFYESPHRIIKTLTSLTEVLSADRQIVVGRELTKKFETIYRGSAEEILKQLNLDKVLGEFVVAIRGK